MTYILKNRDNSRHKISFISISIIIHLLLLLLFGLYNKQANNSKILMSTMFLDNLDVEVSSIDMANETIKKGIETSLVKPFSEESRVNSEKKDSFLNESLISKSNSSTKTENNIVQSNDNDQNETDTFAEYEKQKALDASKIKDNFFKDKGENGNTNNSGNDQGLDDVLSNAKESSKGNNTGKNEISGNTSGNNGTSGQTIKWGSNSNRKLVNLADIVPPKDMAETGLKPTITISFTVFENGLIGQAEIAESTGNTSWDQEILKQFKKTTFETKKGQTSTGMITFNFDYK
jgi:TonB family protein